MSVYALKKFKKGSNHKYGHKHTIKKKVIIKMLNILVKLSLMELFKNFLNEYIAKKTIKLIRPKIFEFINKADVRQKKKIFFLFSFVIRF